MSWRVASLCDERKFGGSSKKQVIMYLADKASDDGRGIWCSKYTISAFTEISLATIKRIVREFIQLGILVETGTRGCRHGEVKVYAINLGVVAALPSLRAPEAASGTGVTMNPVQCDPATGVTMTPLPGSPRPPNHSRTIPKPPCSAAVVEEPDGFAAVWDAYPEDRRRNRAAAAQAYVGALGRGASYKSLRDAARAYDEETGGYTRSRICFIDNWLRTRRWERYLKQQHEAAAAKEVATLQAVSKAAEWIKQRSPICVHLTRRQVEGVLERGLITPAELEAAGVRI